MTLSILPTVFLPLTLTLALSLHAQAARAAATPPPSQEGLSPQAQLVLDGTRETQLDLWRASPGGDKIMVLVGFHDGSDALFLVDTGAATSVIQKDVADALGIVADPDAGGYIQGLSGQAPWIRGTLPEITLGGFTVRGVDIAIGLPGLPEYIGALPLAGILGNNVWSNFVMTVDYPADRLTLSLDGHAPKRAPTMDWSANSARTTLTLHSEGLTPAGKRTRTTADVDLDVDTGAGGLIIIGARGEPFRGFSTIGEEPVNGLGADLDKIPNGKLLSRTHRIPVARVRLGGQTLAVDASARWLCAEGPCEQHPGLSGLAGYEVLREHRVIFDFPHNRFWMTKTAGPVRQFDALAAGLARELSLHPDDPDRAPILASLQWSSGQGESALQTLQAALVHKPKDPELTVMVAKAKAIAADFKGEIETLAGLEPEDLAEQGVWIDYIDALVLDGQIDHALEIARRASETAAPVPDHSEDFLVALADAQLAAGQVEDSAATIAAANKASPRGGSAHLVRLARIAATVKDRYGVIVAMRDLLRIIPLQGLPIWLYALSTEAGDVATFTRDVETAMARLHPDQRPFDFLGAGYMAVGNEQAARAALKTGHERDCAELIGADRDNCDAWYWALGKERLDEAELKSQSAMKALPGNSAYADTGAVVALARGDLVQARERALLAAKLNPSDPYLLWQVSRLAAM
ncbi:MAG: hypothetical protein EXR69_11585 [Myxococcales bacterium]|nr:hypothetical protein [Myxococcales bacterium]